MKCLHNAVMKTIRNWGWGTEVGRGGGGCEKREGRLGNGSGGESKGKGKGSGRGGERTQRRGEERGGKGREKCVTLIQGWM